MRGPRRRAILVVVNTRWRGDRMRFELGQGSVGMRLTALGCMLVAVVCGLTVSSARAAGQFTIDPSPDSFGAVVTDAVGNGYVAWEHLGRRRSREATMRSHALRGRSVSPPTRRGMC